MKLATDSHQQLPSEETNATERQRLQRYSIWSDLEALKILEQNCKDIHILDKKVSRTRLLFFLGSVMGGVLFILLFWVLSLTYTELQFLKQQFPQIPEKTGDVRISPHQFHHPWEV